MNHLILKYFGCCECHQAVLEHNAVTEAAVVGLPDKLKGHVPIGLCVLRTGRDYLFFPT